jgi:penicillin-binding protein 1A
VKQVRILLQTFINLIILVACGLGGLGLAFAATSVIPTIITIQQSIPPLKNRNYQNLETFPADLRGAVLYLEDPNFYQHWGVNTEAVQAAIIHNYKRDFPLQGGSSISQQLGRTLLLSTQKNLLRKALELEAALIFELMLNKDRIFELYLNSIPLGAPQPGFYNAARFYYKSDLSELTIEQKVALLSIMPSPGAYKPSTYSKSSLLLERSKQAYYWFQHLWPQLSQQANEIPALLQ